MVRVELRYEHVLVNLRMVEVGSGDEKEFVGQWVEEKDLDQSRILYNYTCVQEW